MKRLESTVSLADRKGERGSVLAISAFGMLALVLALGLCVDVSHWYVVKAELQNAADASALAGASALNSAPAGIDVAQARAVELMNNYEFNNTGVTITPESVKFAVNEGGPYLSASDAKGQAANIRFVSVDIPSKDVGVYFAASAVGKNSVALTQKAVAGMSVPPNVFCEWIPLAVIDDTANPMMPGQTYTIRSEPGGFVSPGNYQILAPTGRGGSAAREDLAKGVNECAEPGDTYTVDTKPGVAAGPVRQGLNTRFDDYSSGMDADDYPPDTNVKENITWNQYRAAVPGSSNWQSPRAGHPGVPMRRVVLIPMVKLSEFDPGRDTVTFYKFAAFFLQAKVDGGSGGNVKAEYIGERIMFGKGGFKPGGGPVNPQLAQPVLYK
ncbi:MAG TPA: pilus assembly protein TadG-related protein [Pyrinomonadaceae bacterium]|jgi:Flp pilus assembly protein TadG|nr:pilus assembly protein TadG-related protein [Pyrinomonadaceae bacterium]